MSANSMAVLAAASRLFAWVGPSRPEDLAFWTPTGHPWLGSIAHERDGFLYADRWT
jgi:hypothetical protein